MNDRSSAKRRALHWLVPLATVLLLALFARSVDWRHSWRAIISADPTLLIVATLANLASLVVKGIRWSLFLDAVGVPGVGEAIRATMAGAALNNVLVANGGDAARVAAVARRAQISSATVLATLAVDRFCDLVTYAMLFVVAAFALTLPPALARWRTAGLIALAIIGVVAVMLVRQRPSSAVKVGAASADKLSLLTRARAYWQTLASTTSSVATAPRLAVALLLALIAWAGQWATFHYAAHAASFATTPSASLLALLVVNASFLVRLTPGNVGVFQLLYALAATSTGLDKDSAVAVAFLIQLIQYIPVTVVGLLLVPTLTGRRHQTGEKAASTSRVDRNQSIGIRGEGHRGA